MGARPVIKSYKKVLNFAGASHAGATDILFPLSEGVDSISAGQSTVVDGTIPTGSVLKFIELQYTAGNLSAVFNTLNFIIQQLQDGQTGSSPITIGGDKKRNQVHLQGAWSIGEGQNSTHVIRFKIPKRFQRVREGDKWFFIVRGSATFSDQLQVIYKFYQ